MHAAAPAGAVRIMTVLYAYPENEIHLNSRRSSFNSARVCVAAATLALAFAPCLSSRRRARAGTRIYCSYDVCMYMFASSAWLVRMAIYMSIGPRSGSSSRPSREGPVVMEVGTRSGGEHSRPWHPATARMFAIGTSTPSVPRWVILYPALYKRRWRPHPGCDPVAAAKRTRTST
jgi:hypothetical protein